jgi:peptidoglycan hydrolase-like protein with peptidoglycan-binding domain
VLSIGARGDAVKELQRALISMGVYVAGGADGVFGPATRTAVTNFQRWNGLTVSGDVDAATAARLKLGTGSNSGGSGGGSSSGGEAASSSFVGMKLGARGENVKVLQQALINAGISVRGGADGWFGPATQAALISYQQANGLTSDGVVNSGVVSKLGLTAGSAPAPVAPPAASPSAPYVGLTVGARGDLVKDLQRALMNTGLSLRGGADGVFGNATKATLIAFQGTAGTTQNGIVSERDATVLGLGSNTAPPVVTQTGYPVFGERGERVRALQQSLLNAGISFAGGADGVFGSATAGAILTFQRRVGLPATGKVDKATADRLGTAAAPAPPPASSTVSPSTSSPSRASAGTATPGSHHAAAAVCTRASTSSLPRASCCTPWCRARLEDLHRQARGARRQRSAHRPGQRHLLHLPAPRPVRRGHQGRHQGDAGQVIGTSATREPAPHRTCTSRCIPAVAPP